MSGLDVDDTRQAGRVGEHGNTEVIFGFHENSEIVLGRYAATIHDS